MIEDPPLLTIRRNIPRPSSKAVAALTGVPTGNVVDCMDGYGALDYRIKPLDPQNASFAGVAVTCYSGPADNLAIFGAVELAQEGDVIIAATDGCTSAAVVGDLLLGMARNRGIAALVTDGLARDVDGILGVGMPVFSQGVSPNSAARNGPGTAGLPVVLGAVAVASGDVIIGDRDGVVVVPQDRLDTVLAKLPDVQAAEVNFTAVVDAGLQVPEFVQALMESDRVKTID